MIRSHIGPAKEPFSPENMALLPHQREVLDTLRVHCQQGGLCVIVGEPGTGKSVIKHALCQHGPNRIITPVVVNRTLHTYHSTLRILCEAFQIETDGADFRCEKRLIEEARRLNGARQDARAHHRRCALDGRAGPPPYPSALRRFPREPLPRPRRTTGAAQPPRLDRQRGHQKPRHLLSFDAENGPDSLADFIRGELDKVALAHSTFTDDALALIVRSSEGVLRPAKNLCLGAMLEAVRDRIKTVDLKQVNRVLLQPQWRKVADLPQ